MLPYVTINAAASVGLAAQIGSLSPGKQADIILVNGESFATFLAEPAEKIVHYASPDDVDTVLVAGRIVKQHGKLTGIQNLDKLLGEAKVANKRLLENK